MSVATSATSARSSGSAASAAASAASVAFRLAAAVLIPVLAYPDVREAVDWLCDAFGFRRRLLIGDHRAQLVFADGAVVVTRSDSPPGDTHAVLVRVEDADAHHARAAGHGARILNPPADYPYGERQYTAEDLDGHSWTFSESLADVDPASWGGTLVDAG